MPYLLFLLCALIWSASFILMKKATLGFTPMGVGAWRCVWGAAILLLLCWKQNILVVPRRSTWLPIGIVSILACAWPYAIQPVVVARQGSAFMALAVSMLPLATILASIPLLGTWPSLRQVVGVCGALICLGVLLADGLSRHIPLSDFGYALTVPVGYSIANTAIRKWLRDIPAPTLTLYLLFIGAAMLLPLNFREHPRDSVSQDWWLAWSSLAVLGILGTGLATFWFNQLIRDHGPLFAGMTTNLVPIGAVVWGWADEEDVSARQLVALIGIVAMVALVQIGAARGRGETAEARLGD